MMEQQIAQALTLLEEKNRLFGCYETATDCLAAARETDEMDRFIVERETLATSIDEIDREVKMLLQPWGEQAAQVLSGTCREEELPPSLQPVQQICYRIFEKVRRIRMKNSDITTDFEQQRQESLRQIKSTQNQPKISRYLTNLTGENTGNPLGKV